MEYDEEFKSLGVTIEGTGNLFRNRASYTQTHTEVGAGGASGGGNNKDL